MRWATAEPETDSARVPAAVPLISSTRPVVATTCPPAVIAAWTIPAV